MTKTLLHFAKNSFLFQKKSIEDRYSRYSESHLESELDNYRRFSLENANNKQVDKQNLNVLVEATNQLPDEKFLKQTALYVQKVFINDPVFKFTMPKNNYSSVMNDYLGMKNSGIDRGGLSKAAQYIIHHHKAMQADFIDFLPLNFLHEPPKDIPIKFSEVMFSDVLPPEVLDFFRQNVKIVPIQKREGSWFIDPNAKLTPCRAIDITFGGDTNLSFPYMLFDMDVVSSNKETGYVEFLSKLPDNPPSEQNFNNWVSQSINQASRHFFDDVYKDVSLSSNLGATYLTQSNFIHQFLERNIPTTSNLKTDVLNLTMNLELPILGDVSLEHIIDIRQKDGDSFENFRVELERQLRELRSISEPSDLNIRLENITHELMDVQIREIDRKISSIKRKMFPDALILVGGLATVIQAQGFGIPALIYAIQNGYKTYQEYASGVKEKPAFFLWKLKNKM